MAQDRVSPGRQGRQSLSFWGQAGETYLGLMADLGLMVPLAFSRQVHAFHTERPNSIFQLEKIFSLVGFLFFPSWGNFAKPFQIKT
ncbi:MAG: hypothetical protein ACI3X4_00360, partial [Bacteroidaceae bacterium]